MKYPFNFCPKFFTINKFSTKYLLIFNGHLCTARTYLEKETNNLSMGITVISCMFNITCLACEYYSIESRYSSGTFGGIHIKSEI